MLRNLLVRRSLQLLDEQLRQPVPGHRRLHISNIPRTDGIRIAQYHGTFLCATSAERIHLVLEFEALVGPVRRVRVDLPRRRMPPLDGFESEALIQEGLAALMSGRTTFVIAHRLSTIRSADQILVLENGGIVERGTHTQLLDYGGRYFELYTRQAGIEANRFVNPGERELADAESCEGPKERREGLGEVARDLLGFTPSPRS